MRSRPRRPSPAFLVAMLALFVALGGPAQAAKLINGKKIKKGTVSSRQIKDRGLYQRDLSRGTVRALQQTPAGSIGPEQLADAAVGASKLQVGSVTAAALAPNSITGVSLADATIGAPDIAEGAITSAAIANGEVRRADIATGSVGKGEIASAAVTGDEIRDGTLGAKDLGDFSGVLVGVTIPAIPLDDCVAVPSVGISPNVPGATLMDDIVLVGRPADWPTDLTLDAQPVDQTRLSLTVCNLGPVPSPERTATIPFVGIQP